MRSLLVFFTLFGLLGAEYESRIRDLTTLKGAKRNRVYGYGLVVGLSGTGDGRSELAKKTLAQYLAYTGVEAKEASLEGANTAVVAVTADLQGFQQKGDVVDLQVASIGGARSIENGMLLQTVLKGPDGQTYVVAGGIIGTGTGAEKQPRRGMISGGGTVEKDVGKGPGPAREKEPVQLVLKTPSLPMAVAIKEAMEAANPDLTPIVLDDRQISLTAKNPASLTFKAIAELLNLVVTVDSSATVVIDRQTGVVVGGQGVRVDTSFISLPGLRVAVKSGEASPLSGVLKGNTTVSDLANEFNNLGIKPAEMISIFTALRRAGALNAEIVVQ